MHLQAVIFTESFLTVRALIGTLTYNIKAGFLSEKSAAAKQACAPTPPAPSQAPGHGQEETQAHPGGPAPQGRGGASPPAERQ